MLLQTGANVLQKRSNDCYGYPKFHGVIETIERPLARYNAKFLDDAVCRNMRLC
jgi:hypothetical protein